MARRSGLQRSLRTFLFACLAALGLPAGLTAQSDVSSAVRGTVRDSAGIAIADVAITVSCVDGSFVRRATTDIRGDFLVRLLPPGTCSLTAQRLGYSLATRTDLITQAGATRIVNVTMHRRALGLAEVVVTGERPIAEQKGAELGATRVTAEDIRILPTGGDIDRIVAMAPGARGSSMWGADGGAANNYKLDGVSVLAPGSGGAFIQPSTHWIQSIEIKGLGADADEGNFQGGVINVVTKSGSNIVHGSFETNYEAPGLSGSNLRSTTLVPEIDGRRQIAADLGGPLVRDRLFYYLGADALRGDYRSRDHLSADTAALAPFLQVQSDVKLFGKLTYVPSENDFINFAVTRRDQHTEHAGFSGRETAVATTDFTAPTTLVNATWQRLITKAASVELKLQGFDGSESNEPYAGSTVPGIYTYELGTTRSYQNSPFTTSDHAHSVGGTLALDADKLINGAAHHFRLGMEYSDDTWRDLRTRNAGMTWRPRYSYIDHSADTFDPTNALTWQTQTPTSWGGEENLATHTVNSAVFVQDEIKSGHVTLHPGLRLGAWSGDLDPTSVGVSTRTHVLSDAAIDPRLGITIFVPDPETPTRFVVHLGRYHQSAFSDLFDRAAGANAFSDQDVFEYTGPAFSDPSKVFTVAQRNALAASGQFTQIEHVQLSQSGPVADYHQPYVDQLLAGFDVRPDPHWRGEMLFVGRNNHDIVALVDRNEATNFQHYQYVNVYDRTGKQVLDNYGKGLQLPEIYIPNDAIAALLALAKAHPDQYSPPPGFTLASAPPSYTPDYVITNPAGAKREFRQWQITVDAEYPSWRSTLAVEFTGLNGNFSTLTGYDALSIGGFEGILGRGPGPYVRPNEAINFEGGLDQASFTTIKWRFIGTLPLGIRAGLATEYISGDQLTPTFTIVPSAFTFKVLDPKSQSYKELFPLLTQAISRQRIYTRQQGNLRYNGRTSLDLHVEKEFSSRSGNVTLQADGFNILGQDNPTKINTALSSDNDPNSYTKYGTALELQPPRQFRFGAAVSW